MIRRGDSGGETDERVPLGVAVRDSRVPLRYDSNYLYVERKATADEIVAELQRRDLPIATVLGDELAGEPAVDHRGVVMAHRGPVPEPRRRAVEVEHEALRPIRRAHQLSQPWGTPEVSDQLLGAKALIAERVTARFFGSFEGDEVVAGADLYLDPPDAQIEDVVTHPDHRGHGAAVVLTAVAEAHAAGADFVFLVADAEDWPKEWYAKLGFEPIGTYVKLLRR